MLCNSGVFGDSDDDEAASGIAARLASLSAPCQPIIPGPCDP